MGTGFSKQKKQAKMFQEQISQMQDKMKSVEATGTSGNGLVSVTLNGDNEMKKILIKPECVDPQDVDGLQDLIKAAYKDALDKINKQTESMTKMPPGMPQFPKF